MSRSNPTSSSPNPATRHFEWKGKYGHIEYYDKEKEEKVKVPDGFTFLLLDNLSTVTGYNKKAKSGLVSNEVRDTRTDKLRVRFFDGTEIAEGLWADIKEKVAYNSGKFATSLYVAYKDGEDLKIGNFKVSGCALGPWIEFFKNHRQDIHKQAVVVKAGKKDTTGDVEFIPPVFSLKEITEETDEQAKKLDEDVQAYLNGYLSKADPVDQRPAVEPEDEDDSIPF